MSMATIDVLICDSNDDGEGDDEWGDGYDDDEEGDDGGDDADEGDDGGVMVEA